MNFFEVSMGVLIRYKNRKSLYGFLQENLPFEKLLQMTKKTMLTQFFAHSNLCLVSKVEKLPHSFFITLDTSI